MLAKVRTKAHKDQRRSRLVTIGDFEVETRGLAQGFWTDLYHRAMTVYWPVFFGSAALLFLISIAGTIRLRKPLEATAVA